MEARPTRVRARRDMDRDYLGGCLVVVGLDGLRYGWVMNDEDEKFIDANWSPGSRVLLAIALALAILCLMIYAPITV